MSGPHGLCPACLSRVLPDWRECKFCGHALIDVEPAPWAPADDAPKQGGGAIADPSAGLSFFDMYGDFSSVPEEQPALPPAAAEDEQLALPPATPALGPGDGASVDTTPPAPAEDLHGWDAELPPELAPDGPAGGPAVGGPSLFGGRPATRSDDQSLTGAQQPGPAQAESLDSTWGQSSPADEEWWMKPATSSPAGAATIGEPDVPSAVPPPPPPPPSGQSWQAPFGEEESATEFQPLSWEDAAASSLPAMPASPVSELPPPPAPPRISREFRIAALGVALLVVVLIGWVVKSNSDKTSYPVAWDPRIAGLAGFVSGHRHLAFRHAVDVHFLPTAEYVKQYEAESDGRSLKQRRQDLADESAMLRAVGLLQGQPPDSVLASTDDGSLAFYSYRRKALYVRGTTLGVEARVAIAHELTHALQDQWFDLSSLQRDDPSGDKLSAVVEGDAMQVAGDYVDSLSKPDKAAYDKAEAEAAKSDPSGGADVPPIFSTLGSLPSDLGDRFVHLLESTKGTTAVDEAIRVPPASDSQLFDPFRYLAGDRALNVDAPTLPAGARKIRSGEFGTSMLYLMLAKALGPVDALSAADAWGGDQMLSYRGRDGKVCVDARFRGGSDSENAALEHGLRSWASAGSVEGAQVERVGDVLTLHTCDPGASSSSGGSGTADQPQQWIQFVLTRTDLAISLYDETSKVPNGVNGPILTPAATRCIAEAAVRGLPIDQVVSSDPNSIDQTQLGAIIDASTDSCKASESPSGP